jgi:hypothetical protein
MVQRSPLSATLSGISGEYFVAAELSRRGYVASVTLRNTKGIDILASNANATKSVGIQVKTNQGNGRDWVLNKKVESDTATNLFFVFVRLHGVGNVEYHVVPRKEVAAFARKFHYQWLSGRRRDGQPRKDGDMRKFADITGQYRDRWIYWDLIDIRSNPALMSYGADNG